MECESVDVNGKPVRDRSGAKEFYLKKFFWFLKKFFK
ncbi:hypothetical protein Bcer98_4035 (plasmid) [Bacillus cytotoxicus NVH 391-98]|uniref:Uncharacterized protein n=1 Tax=Bacillus cytotoxicus (strain DSM 22905 / CIP 110041 / 391-98 / NVH 391-98) TaxID=315749 RepID=A7GVQ8_BACCN|nr:hypothetical protein Bcer98_4035 [Bacillus cytotoxicus NVH 391-98]